ncbi:conserved hypothetical protein [Deferribacter desulfuricans SSM1]|uniref:Uncharacterized protein n=1 Tax=Deferribacter desulfuricans (strain DSM 14783 / JCM 11476 / NBRC 101012 / SSM1) TaxID=639282 RepID=D3PB37_DEFDS|nr:SoxR reducing system RseC family protein [Deferribacter desulfuricans]BAI79810.1 conserved hypothetical protein [Deferribacter desulfuricans SSM1]
MSKIKKVCGKVIEVNGNKVVVSVVQFAGCSHCESRDTCAVASGKSFQVELVTDKAVKVGDVVELYMMKREIYKNGFLAYILPVVALMFGAIIGSYIDKNFGNGYIAPLLSLLFLAIYFVGLRYYIRNKEVNYKINKII